MCVILEDWCMDEAKTDIYKTGWKRMDLLLDNIGYMDTWRMGKMDEYLDDIQAVTYIIIWWAVFSDAISVLQFDDKLIKWWQIIG